jgi:cobalt/nickel transport system permease protein
MNLLAKNILIPLLFLSASFILLFSVKIPLKAMLRNMLLPMSFAILILFVKGLHEGEREWVSFSVVGHTVSLKEEGLQSGLHTCAKVLGGVSLVIVFSFTTTISRLCAGLKWFRVPNTIIELLAFIYRYIFLLLDEVSTMWVAQKSRLGHYSWKKIIKSFGALGGMLIIRAFERSERTYEAMRARGYEGSGILTVNLPPWRKREYAFVIGIVLVLPLFIYTGNMQIW